MNASLLRPAAVVGIAAVLLLTACSSPSRPEGAGPVETTSALTTPAPTTAAPATTGPTTSAPIVVPAPPAPCTAAEVKAAYPDLKLIDDTDRAWATPRGNPDAHYRIAMRDVVIELSLEITYKGCYE